MRRTVLGLALGLMLPVSIAHADIAGDLNAGLPMQTVFTNAMANNMSAEAALKQVLDTKPELAYAAITAAVQLSPDQGPSILSAALSRQYNLNPPQVVAAALQGAPQKSGTIVPTGIVKSPSYYTVPIVQKALAEGVDGAKFVPQAMRTSPRQADTILSQALRSAPQQTRSIMEAVIADQPDKAVDYVKLALDVSSAESDAEVLAAAFKVAPRQAETIAAAAREKGVPDSVILAAAKTAGTAIAGSDAPGSRAARQANFMINSVSSFLGGTGSGGGGCDPFLATCT